MNQSAVLRAVRQGSKIVRGAVAPTAVAAVVVAVEAASKLAHPLLVMRAGVVTNGLLASQMALAGEHAMMQIAVALFRGSRRSCKHAPMKEAAMME